MWLCRRDVACARCALRVGGIPVGIAAAKLVRDTLSAVDTPSAPVGAELLAGNESMAFAGGLRHLQGSQRTALLDAIH